MAATCRVSEKSEGLVEYEIFYQDEKRFYYSIDPRQLARVEVKTSSFLRTGLQPAVRRENRPDEPAQVFAEVIDRHPTRPAHLAWGINIFDPRTVYFYTHRTGGGARVHFEAAIYKAAFDTMLSDLQTRAEKANPDQDYPLDLF